MIFKVILFFVSLGLYTAPALAYIDPGSGSAIISAIIGVIVALGMFIKTYWYRLKSLFSKNQSPADEAGKTGEDRDC